MCMFAGYACLAEAEKTDSLESSLKINPVQGLTCSFLRRLQQCSSSSSQPGIISQLSKLKLSIFARLCRKCSVLGSSAHRNSFIVVWFSSFRALRYLQEIKSTEMGPKPPSKIARHTVVANNIRADLL